MNFMHVTLCMKSLNHSNYSEKYEKALHGLRIVKVCKTLHTRFLGIMEKHILSSFVRTVHLLNFPRNHAFVRKHSCIIEMRLNNETTLKRQSDVC